MFAEPDNPIEELAKPDVQQIVATDASLQLKESSPKPF